MEKTVDRIVGFIERRGIGAIIATIGGLIILVALGIDIGGIKITPGTPPRPLLIIGGIVGGVGLLVVALTRAKHPPILRVTGRPEAVRKLRGALSAGKFDMLRENVLTSDLVNYIGGLLFNESVHGSHFAHPPTCRILRIY